ncbi:hemerythrin domain-containing protein [Streptomyces chartreusis]|uniref:hemerythrin domain-containing protein n=1 Tax=Streptomyces chartreusis TaxID=1969 RepID=UPI00369FD8D4
MRPRSWVTPVTGGRGLPHEDDVLWPQLIAADPVAGAALSELSTEHDALEAALEALAVAPVQDDADRAALAATAASVRDLVHQHLEHEEPVLFPALAAHMSDEAWTEFSRAVIASAPPVGAHLNLCRKPFFPSCRPCVSRPKPP